MIMYYVWYMYFKVSHSRYHIADTTMVAGSHTFKCSTRAFLWLLITLLLLIYTFWWPSGTCLLTIYITTLPSPKHSGIIGFHMCMYEQYSSVPPLLCVHVRAQGLFDCYLFYLLSAFFTLILIHTCVQHSYLNLVSELTRLLDRDK